MIKFIMKFWPALTPAILYLIWLLFFRKDRKGGEDTIPEWEEKLWTRTLWLSMIIMIICVATFAFTTESNRDSKYVPAKYEDGKLIPAQIIPPQNNNYEKQ